MENKYLKIDCLFCIKKWSRMLPLAWHPLRTTTNRQFDSNMISSELTEYLSKTSFPSLTIHKSLFYSIIYLSVYLFRYPTIPSLTSWVSWRWCLLVLLAVRWTLGRCRRTCSACPAQCPAGGGCTGVGSPRARAPVACPSWAGSCWARAGRGAVLQDPGACGLASLSLE